MQAGNQNKISLLMPTRGRPAWVNRFFKSVINCSSDTSRIEIILYVDDDDVESHNLNSDELDVKLIIGPRITMGGYNTECLKKATGDIIILVNDDMVIRTIGWDDKIELLDRSMPDGLYLAYGNDLFKGGDLCTFPILSRKTCELLGSPYPLQYRGAFIDYHLFDIFQRLKHAGHNRTLYLEDVVFEHLHFRAGKAEADETYTKRGRFDDDATFLALTESRREAFNKLLNELSPGSPIKNIPKAKGISEKDFLAINIFQTIHFLTKEFLFDKGLPIKYRCFLWYWFIGRTLAFRGYLRMFGIKNA